MRNHQIIPRSLNEKDLPKKAIAILRKCDRLINFNISSRNESRSISLFRQDKTYLKECLSKTKQDINNVTYKGFFLK